MSETMIETRRVTVERDYPHPPHMIWRALTEPQLLAEWLMRGDISPQLGHRFELSGEWGGTIECEVLEVEPDKRLCYSWNFPNSDPAYALESMVTFTLRATDTGTHLSLEQTGFRPDQTQAIGGAKAGWTQFLGKLATLLSRVD